MYVRRMMVMAGLVMAVSMSGCGPAFVDKFAKVESNHTAFVIPAEGNSNGKQFFSAEYLAEKKVPVTRHTLKQRKRSTGRYWWSYEYIPTEFVLVIDRAQKSHKWTGNRALAIETGESVNFYLDLSLTCEIAEPDAPLYVSIFGAYKVDEEGKKTPFLTPGAANLDGSRAAGTGSDPSLERVMETHVRGFVLGELSHDLGTAPITELEARVGPAVEKTFAKAKEYFRKQGITVVSIGLEGGIRYDNPELQKLIDERFTSVNDIEVAKSELVTAKNKNAREVSKVTAEVAAANERAKAKEAALLRAKLDLQLAEAEAAAMAAEAWDGIPSRMVPQGAAFLFGFDRRLTPPALDLKDLPTAQPPQQPTPATTDKK